MSAFNPKKRQLPAAHWQELAHDSIEETGSQYLVIGGIVGGLFAASVTAFPPTGLLVAGWAFYEAWRKTAAANRNEGAISQHGCVAHVLKGDSLREFAEQVGSEEVLNQISWARKNGYFLSADAEEFLEVEEVKKADVANEVESSPKFIDKAIAIFKREPQQSSDSSDRPSNLQIPIGTQAGNLPNPMEWLKGYLSSTALVWGNQGSGKSWFVRLLALKKAEMGYWVIVFDPNSNAVEWKGVELYNTYASIEEKMRWYVDEVMKRYEDFGKSTVSEEAWRSHLWKEGKAVAIIAEEATTYADFIEDKELLGKFVKVAATLSRKQEMPVTFVAHNNTQRCLGDIKGLANLIARMQQIQLLPTTDSKTSQPVASGKALIRLDGSTEWTEVATPKIEKKITVFHRMRESDRGWEKGQLNLDVESVRRRLEFLMNDSGIDTGIDTGITQKDAGTGDTGTDTGIDTTDTEPDTSDTTSPGTLGNTGSSNDTKADTGDPFTPARLTRFKAIQIIQQMKVSGLSQTQIIQALWGCEKNKAGWKQAYQQFKELTEGSDEK